MEDIAEDVIRRAAQGDISAFEEILEAYGDLVFNVCLRVVRNREDAEEVSQEVLLTIYQRLKDFQGRSSLKTWIYRITLNAAIRYANRASNKKGKFVEYDEALHAEERKSDVEKTTEEEHVTGLVDRLLGELSEEQRTCIVLRNVEGMTYEGISEVLGININAVRSRLKRARNKLLSIRKEVMADEVRRSPKYHFDGLPR